MPGKKGSGTRRQSGELKKKAVEEKPKVTRARLVPRITPGEFIRKTNLATKVEELVREHLKEWGKLRPGFFRGRIIDFAVGRLPVDREIREGLAKYERRGRYIDDLLGGIDIEDASITLSRKEKIQLFEWGAECEEFLIKEGVLKKARDIERLSSLRRSIRDMKRVAGRKGKLKVYYPTLERFIDRHNDAVNIFLLKRREYGNNRELVRAAVAFAENYARTLLVDRSFVKGVEEKRALH